MKIIFNKTITGVLVAISFASCNKDSLTDKNKNPDAIEYIIPQYAFTNVAYSSIPPDSYRALGQGLQYYSTYKEVPAVGDKFYNFNGTNGSFSIYNTQLNQLRRIVKEIPGPDNVNKRAACMILEVLIFHRQTDLMGDLPYSEALVGDENLTPKYDTQKSIYAAMLTNLETALTSMDVSKANVFGNADPYFQGDVAKWKKFGYSLMLRLGMRMSDVEPVLAKSWSEKAATGGVITAFSDIAYIKYADVTGQMNPRVARAGSSSLINGDYASPGGDNVEGSKWAAKFINHLKTTNDPRLPVLSVVWVPAGGNTYTPNNTPTVQKGMVNGSINTRPTDFDTYSEPSLLYLDRASPIITFGNAETYLLLAEGAARGWNMGTTAKAAYDNGVRAAMQQWSLWRSVAPHSNVITTAQVDAYLAANSYSTGTFAQQLEQISTQKWISMLGDDYEVFSNWRRTKFPVFRYANWVTAGGAVTAFPGNVTGGKMWRRFSLPNTERDVNGANYQEAIKRQNFTEDQIDLLQGRMWWDAGSGTGQNP